MSGLPSSESMFLLLWNATWQSALLALVVLLLLRSVGRWIAPSWRVALAAIPLLRLVVLVLPVTSFSLFQFVDHRSVSSPEALVDEPAATAVAYPQPQPTTFAAAAPSVEPTESADGESRSADLTPTVVRLAIFVWIGGVAVFAGRWFHRSMVLRRMLRRGDALADLPLQLLVDSACRQANLFRSVRCILTDQEIGPATCGLLRPKIMIPKQLARELLQSDLQIVIAHEVEHIRRCDCIWLTLGQLAVALHWFNPLAYGIRRVFQCEIELAVDASTLGKLGPARAREYGDLLLRIVGRAKPSLCVVPMASAGTNLRRRIEQMLRWRRPHRRHHVLGAVTAGVLAFAGLTENDPKLVFAQNAESGTDAAVVDARGPNTPAAQDDQNSASEAPRANQKTQSETRRASGRVIDAGGNPVAGARLFAEVYTTESAVARISQAANAKGEFSIEFPESHRYDSYHTWAYAEGHGVRVVNMGRVFVEGGGSDVEIQLPKIEPKELQIHLPTGQACVDALVRPRYVDVPNGVFAADEPTGLSAYVPEQMKPLLTRKTDQDGRVSIESIPLSLLDSIEIETPEYGHQHFRKLDATLRLSAVGALHGSLKVESPHRFAGTKVIVNTDYGREHEGLAETELDQTGRFQIPAVAHGKLLIHLSWDLNAEVQPFVVGRLSVAAGETLDLDIEVRPAIPVTGRILTSDTREPIRGAEISHLPSWQGFLRFSNYVRTDQQGRYSTRLPVGEARRQVFGGVESPYEYPRPEPIVIPANATEYEVAEILVHPKRMVKGKLVDHQGHPVSDTTVVLHTGSFRHVAGKADTNPDGSFEMHVRDWEYYSKSPRGGRHYWAILKSPAINVTPPQFTRLNLLDENPDALLLVRPREQRDQ